MNNFYRRIKLSTGQILGVGTREGHGSEITSLSDERWITRGSVRMPLFGRWWPQELGWDGLPFDSPKEAVDFAERQLNCPLTVAKLRESIASHRAQSD